MAISAPILPLYTLYFYNEYLYKVVKFKRRTAPLVLHDQKENPEERFASSYSRSRSMVLQYALCNPWDYFITITVDEKKFNRYELDPIYDALYAFFKSYRSTLSPSFRFLLVPEYHEDKAWHFHGLVRGILPQHLSDFVAGIHPWKLVGKGYLNWAMLGNAIGYVSLSKLKNATGAAFYVTKYITKQHANDSFYSHLYYHSRGLSRARPVADCYLNNYQLDEALTYEAPFCSTGWLHVDDGDFSYPFTLSGCLPRDEEQLLPLDDLALQVEPLPPFEDFQPVQLTLQDWLEMDNRLFCSIVNAPPNPPS